MLSEDTLIAAFLLCIPSLFFAAWVFVMAGRRNSRWQHNRPSIFAVVENGQVRAPTWATVLLDTALTPIAGQNVQTPRDWHAALVEKHLRARIDGALKARRLSVRDLGRATKLRSAMTTVCALICRRILYTELSTKFGPASWVARRADPSAGTSPPVQRQKLTATAGELGGSKR